MCTFADGEVPSAVKVLKDVIYFDDYFYFNNSALYVPSEKGSANSKFILKLRISSVKSFSINISQKFASLSLTMSKEVMIKRNWLFISVQSSRQRINDTFDLLEELIELLELIKKIKNF